MLLILKYASIEGQEAEQKSGHGLVVQRMF